MHPFINKLLCFLLAIALVVALAVPVFAVDVNEPDFPELPEHDGMYILIRGFSDGTYQLTLTSTMGKYDNGGIWFSSGTKYTNYNVISSGASSWGTVVGSGTWNSDTNLNALSLFTDYTINNKDGSFYQGAYFVSYCDGSSCPATDADHDNICDDCGSVLAYNLRSTLLDFAKTTAESFSDGYPYYAILEHPTKDASYNLFISKSPMHADVPNYDVAIGESMQYTEVFTNDDGSFDRATWASVASFSGTLVYSNHTIENFQTPLAVVIQGVTGRHWRRRYRT